jgi:diaminopimelate decarboxylase
LLLASLVRVGRRIVGWRSRYRVLVAVLRDVQRPDQIIAAVDGGMFNFARPSLVVMYGPPIAVCNRAPCSSNDPASLVCRLNSQ